MILEAIDALSDDVCEGLAAAGCPKLLPLLNGKPGRILVGAAAQFDEFSPPRIIFTPTTAKWGGRTNTRGPVPPANNTPVTGPDAQSRVAASVRTLFTESLTFEVAVCSLQPKSELDLVSIADYFRVNYEQTRALYCQIIASLQHVMPGNYAIAGGGKWMPMRHLDIIVFEFIFQLAIDYPILEELPPSPYAPDGSVLGHPYAPAGTVANITDELITNPGVDGMPHGNGQPGDPAGGVDAAFVLTPDPGTRVAGPGCEE